MTDPEHALEVARRRASEMRREGAYPGADFVPARAAGATAGPDSLLEWALIRTDPQELRSSRRVGALITGVRRLLIRLLGQYHGDLLRDQSRFNLEVMSHVRALEARTAELECQLGADAEGPPTPEGP